MKKWEEERKKKQYNDKISKVKPTMSTQPKGAKVLRTPTSSGGYGYDGYIHPGQANETGEYRSQYPARGNAEFGYDQGPFEMDQNSNGTVTTAN